MKRWLLLLALTTLLAAQTEKEITDEPHHQLTFMNAHVRVFDVKVPARTETLMHWHRHDYIYVTIGDTELSNEVEGKPPVALKLHDGEVRFTPGPLAHLVRVTGAQPFHNVTVELLEDERRRHAPEHWDAAHRDDDRGLEVLHGGTKETLFVKDGVRAIEYELQPGGVAPMPAGEYLFICVSDVRLEAVRPPNAPHNAWSSWDQKASFANWIPKGVVPALRNEGHAPAKFVTLEFK